ncbi:MAG: RNA-binding S4 domain-containing protein [Gammaproteobacteria bacterium]|nr:RNA-binding S4 domain-containing protein [Gammaproteobacteria bacterium]
MSQNITFVILERTPTELYKILKFEGLASSGAEAKIFIAEGLVKVNGKIETQKRKKIIAGDIVEYNNNILQIRE